MLKLNPEKTHYMITCKNRIRVELKNLAIVVNNNTIKPVDTITILGTYLQNNLKWDTEVGKISANLHNRIYNIKKFNSLQILKPDYNS